MLRNNRGSFEPVEYNDDTKRFIRLEGEWRKEKTDLGKLG
jgi:hypothetical protein